MDDMSEAAMQEAVENSHAVLAVMTGDGPDDEIAFLKRPFCLKELRWAFEKGTHVQPVVHQKDKERIGEFIKMAPADLKRIGSIDFVHLDSSDKQYWNVGLGKIVDKANKAKARGVCPQGRSSTRRPSTVGHGSRAAVAPEPAADGAVEPASGASLDANTEAVSEETVAPSDGEIEELQLGTTEIDLPELKDRES